VQEVIGQGGFGIVLKAFDEKLHRVVAIKVLSPAFAASGPARKRFIREARAAAAVKNEHVVAIYNVQDEEQPPYLVMEFIDGISLQDKLNRHGPLSLKEILRIGMQTAEGLAAAHKQGLVHRDIKPGNILLENGVERVKITDFGLARAVDDASVTQSGTVAGTPLYMSPEQAEGLALDHRSDLFSLGTVLYVMCTGRPPFRASGTMAVLKRVVEDAPRSIPEINDEIPQWLCDIIAKLHAKKPEERFQSAKEVADVLAKHLADVQAHGPAREPVPGKALRPTKLPRPRASRGRQDVLTVVMFVLLAVAFACTATWIHRYLRNVGFVWIEADGAGSVDFDLFHDGQVVKKLEGLGYQGFELTPGDYELQARYDKTRWGCEFEQSWNTSFLAGGAASRGADRLRFSVNRGGDVNIKAKMIARQPAQRIEEARNIENAPPPAVVPFDAARAKAHQEAWAEHLGAEVEITNSVGMEF
jgi:hypothetical protein